MESECDMARLLKLMTSCARKMKKTAAVMAFRVERHDRELPAQTLLDLNANAKQLKAAAGIVRSWMKFMFPKKKEALISAAITKQIGGHNESGHV